MSKPLQRRTTSHGANGGMLDRRVTLMDIDQLQEDGAYLPTADDAEIVADVEQSSSEPLSASASHAQAFKFGLTGLSAMTAESATFPVDMCKTRMQLSGEGVGGARQSIFGAAAEIVRREGPLGLYAGVSPAICRHIPYTGSRVGLYESLRGRFTTPGVEAGIEHARIGRCDGRSHSLIVQSEEPETSRPWWRSTHCTESVWPLSFATGSSCSGRLAPARPARPIECRA